MNANIGTSQHTLYSGGKTKGSVVDSTIKVYLIACAESGAADVFLTTDDKLLRRAIRLAEQLRIPVANPLNWLVA